MWFSCSVVSDSLRSHELQHARLPCPSPSPWVCFNSCPLSQCRSIFKIYIFHRWFWLIIFYQTFQLARSLKMSLAVTAAYRSLHLTSPTHLHFQILWNLQRPVPTSPPPRSLSGLCRSVLSVTFAPSAVPSVPAWASRSDSSSLRRNIKSDLPSSFLAQHSA